MLTNLDTEISLGANVSTDLLQRYKRSTALIADFSSGYAAGWKFAVPTCFRDSLDIKWMARTINEKDANGKPIFVNEWTQGILYNFHEGAILYNDKIAYETSWREALKVLKYSIQIKKITSSINTPSGIHYGSIDFELYKPLKDQIGFESVDIFSCLQDKFVAFLKTGILETSSGEVKDFSLEL